MNSRYIPGLSYGGRGSLETQRLHRPYEFLRGHYGDDRKDPRTQLSVNDLMARAEEAAARGARREADQWLEAAVAELRVEATKHRSRFGG